MTDLPKPEAYVIHHSDNVEVIEFSPFELSGQLLAIGSTFRVTVGLCKFQAEEPEVDGVEFEHIRDFHHGTRITALAWSPETTLYTVPRLVRFCTAGGDKKLRLFTSNLKEDDSVQIIEGHRDYINSVTFDPDKGEEIASVSDDLTCRIFGTDGQQHVCFPLQSPGMNVCWHAEDPMKLMVSEKSGVIRFYNLISHQPIMSLDCGHAPIISADWCFRNVLQVAALSNNEWYLFDTSQSSCPLDGQPAHSKGSCLVKWSRNNEHVYATTGANGGEIKVWHSQQSQPILSTTVQYGSGLSWHHNLPVVAVGGDKKIYFWFTDRV